MTTYADVLSTIESLIFLASPKDQKGTKVILADQQFAEPQNPAESPVILFDKYALNPGKPGGSKIHWVNSKNKFYSILGSYKSIDELYLFFHGAPGQIEIGGSPEYADELFSRSEEKYPMINQLTFLACNVGQNAKRLFNLALLRQIKRVTAWNFFRAAQPVPIDGKLDEGAIAEILERYDGYLLEHTPDAQTLVDAAKKIKQGFVYIGIEWFIENQTFDQDGHPSQDGLPDTLRGRYQKRSNAQNKLITSLVEAETYDQTQGPVAGKDFTKVAVEIPEQ